MADDPDLTRLAHVSSAHVTQILDLLLCAPDKAEVIAEGANCRFVVTNLKGIQHHLCPLYQDCGTAKPFIGGSTSGLQADGLSCLALVANAFRLPNSASYAPPELPTSPMPPR